MVREEDLNNTNSSQNTNESRKTSGSISVSVENSTDEFLNLSKMPDIILDFSAVNYIDTNGVKAVQQLIEYYKSKDIHVYICNSQG
jgi:anti-anti-sigma regulatory factor